MRDNSDPTAHRDAHPDAGRDADIMAYSGRSLRDLAPEADPDCSFWREAPRVRMDRDCQGLVVAKHATEVRSLWTPANLYFLFICPYERLHLKPDPQWERKTERLWEWDVAEVFLGPQRGLVHRYREFEMSPRGEWLDLAIDLEQPDKISLENWQSGIEVAARIDRTERQWYGCMRLPFACIDRPLAAIGDTFRVNFFRSQGPDPIEIAWRAPMQASFHAPERFGTLELVDSCIPTLGI